MTETLSLHSGSKFNTDAKRQQQYVSTVYLINSYVALRMHVVLWLQIVATC